MKNEDTKLSVKLPQDIKNGVESGDFTISGSVRAKNGQFVCHLEAFQADEEHFFSSSLFIVSNNYLILSDSIRSLELEKHLEDIKLALDNSSNKLDIIIKNQNDDMDCLLTAFDELFAFLKNGSTLTTKEKVLESGVLAAARIAPRLTACFNDYLNGTQVFYSEYDERYRQYQPKRSSFSDYLKEHNSRVNYSRSSSRITSSEFSNFKSSEAYYYSYKFIEILNNINLLSLLYDSCTYPKYESNLLVIRKMLSDTLEDLILGIGKEGDIYEMYHHAGVKDENLDVFFYFDGRFTIGDLIFKSFPEKNGKQLDKNRVISARSIIEIIEDIDNLINRQKEIYGIELSDDIKLAISKEFLSNINY